MGKAVIVFSFEEPQNSEGWGEFITQAKDAIADQFGENPSCTVHVAIAGSANRILRVLQPNNSNLVAHAKKELDLTENDEEFKNCIINAVDAFSAYGHSGGSAAVGIHILYDLLQFKNLTPLTDNPDEWNEVGTDTWQSSRNSEAFSDDGGKTYYLLSERDALPNGGELPIHESVASNAET